MIFNYNNLFKLNKTMMNITISGLYCVGIYGAVIFAKKYLVKSIEIICIDKNINDHSKTRMVLLKKNKIGRNFTQQEITKLYNNVSLPKNEYKRDSTYIINTINNKKYLVNP